MFSATVLRGPKDNNDAVLENGPVFRVRIGVRTTVRNGPVRRLGKETVLRSVFA